MARHLPKWQLNVIKPAGTNSAWVARRVRGLNRARLFEQSYRTGRVSDYHLSDDRDTMANSAAAAGVFRCTTKRTQACRRGPEIVQGRWEEGRGEGGRDRPVMEFWISWPRHCVGSCSRQRRQTWKPHSPRSGVSCALAISGAAN